MEGCSQVNRIKNMEADIKELRRDIHGEGDEIGMKGTMISLNSTLKELSVNISKKDKAMDSIIQATTEWQTMMRIKKEFEMKDEKRKQNLKWIIGSIITFGSLVLTYLGLK